MKLKPYEWMVNYTPQTEWIERRGILFWLAEVTGGLGAGLYLVALLFNNFTGMLIGWLIVLALKGGFHLAFLGKPIRFWRMVFSSGWKTSWISRGLIFVVLFLGFAFLQLATAAWAPGSALETLFKVLAAITAFGLLIYTGLVMNYVNGIPFWNTGLLPVLLVFTGILDGFGLMTMIALLGGKVNITDVENGSRVMLLAVALLIFSYIWSATYTGPTGKRSVAELLRGQAAPVFWVGVVAAGIVVPVIISVTSLLAGDASAPLLLFGVACDTVGAFCLKYAVLKVGVYGPLIPSSYHN